MYPGLVGIISQDFVRQVVSLQSAHLCGQSILSGFLLVPPLLILEPHNFFLYIMGILIVLQKLLDIIFVFFQFPILSYQVGLC